MKRLLAITAIFAASALAEQMTGIVTDAKCKHTDTSAKSIACAKACIKGGEKAVFINTADQKVYTITNPDKLGDHVGHRVTVNGTVDGDNLTVETIKMAKG